MGHTQGHHILQLCMGPSHFWRGLTPPDPPLFRTLTILIIRLTEICPVFVRLIAHDQMERK